MPAKRLDRRLYDLLETPRPRGAGRWVQYALFTLIVVNVVAVVLETVPAYAAAYRLEFLWLEIVSVAIFLVEYLARLYACVRSPIQRFRHPVKGRLRYALTPYALIDLAAILPLFLFAFTGVDLGELRVVRLLRVLKLMRYAPATAALGRVVYNERKALAGTAILFVILLLLASTAVYFAERKAQPQTFGSIPAAMWWAMAALTTVGYGDVTPITPLGRIVGGFVTLLGIGVIALPTGIIAGAFIEEHKRRDFVVNWSLIASVPFFRSLTAQEIADLATHIEAQYARPGDEIVRKGEEGDALYIVSSGEVEVDLGPERDPAALGEGEFFGEMALLAGGPRRATVRAVTECKLLRLGAEPLHAIMREHPEIGTLVRETAAQRAAGRARAGRAGGEG